MENSRITINSKYKSVISFDDFQSVNDILISYYLPIIKSDAFSLYLALLVDARNSMINNFYTPVERVVTMIDSPIEKIESSISKLELVNLLEVFIDEEENIIFKLLKPLSPEEFNSSEQFTQLLRTVVGKDNLIINNKLFNSMKDKDIDFDNITTKSIDISDRVDNPAAKLNVDFDFESIKKIINARNIDWSSFWTKELEQEILNIIVLYRVTSFDIALELIKEIELGEFNMENVITRIRNDYIVNEDITSLIDAGENTTEVKMDFLTKLSTKDYIIHRLNRVPTSDEENMISELITKYNLSEDKINILIDYSLIVNNEAIVINYILKIAETVIKDNLNTTEKIVEHLKISYNLRKGKDIGEDHTQSDSFEEIVEDKPIF